ncbi:hypothetical protein INR49_027585 [Caranx melampygus]|nr:hypothetical protein INR49_027585 [Caranx melampygus]
MGTYLHLPAVNEWDSGIYTCDISSFPSGSIRRETELKIKDVLKVTCSEDRAVDVRSGENVKIHCKASANAQHRWTKNKMLVSESESLELWQVTDAHAGVYTLTVNRGNESLCKEFIITVLTATTSSQTDLSTVSPQSYVTEEGLTEPAESSFTTSSTTEFSSHDTSVTWTMSAGTDITDNDLRPRNVTIAAGENITSFTHDAHVSVTSAPATPTHTDPFHHVNSTTLSYNYTVFRSTQETATDEAKNKSMPHRPEDVFSNMTEDSATRNITQSYDATPAPNTAAPGPGNDQ